MEDVNKAKTQAETINTRIAKLPTGQNLKNLTADQLSQVESQIAGDIAAVDRSTGDKYNARIQAAQRKQQIENEKREQDAIRNTLKRPSVTSDNRTQPGRAGEREVANIYLNDGLTARVSGLNLRVDQLGKQQAGILAAAGK